VQRPFLASSPRAQLPMPRGQQQLPMPRGQQQLPMPRGQQLHVYQNLRRLSGMCTSRGVLRRVSSAPSFYGWTTFPHDHRCCGGTPGPPLGPPVLQGGTQSRRLPPVRCASAGAERPEGGLRAGPAYVVIPQGGGGGEAWLLESARGPPRGLAPKVRRKVTTSAFGCTVSLLLRRDPESFSVAERREGAR
jgi:hypothetical protein